MIDIYSHAHSCMSNFEVATRSNNARADMRRSCSSESSVSLNACTSHCCQYFPLRGEDSTVYGVPDLKTAALDTRQAEGQQVRSFQIAIARLSNRPEFAKALIHKPGQLYHDPSGHDDLADVYRCGLEEIGRLLTGVRAAPSWEALCDRVSSIFIVTSISTPTCRGGALRARWRVHPHSNNYARGLDAEPFKAARDRACPTMPVGY